MFLIGTQRSISTITFPPTRYFQEPFVYFADCNKFVWSFHMKYTFNELFNAFEYLLSKFSIMRMVFITLTWIFIMSRVPVFPDFWKKDVVSLLCKYSINIVDIKVEFFHRVSQWAIGLSLKAIYKDDLKTTTILMLFFLLKVCRNNYEHILWDSVPNR